MSPDTEVDRLLTFKEVATILGVTRRTVERYVNDGALAAFKLGDYRTSPIRIRRSVLFDFIEERERSND